jgi:hypothetical protein
VNARLAPGVTFTRLPHGGGVVVNGTRLELAECGEREADLIALLIAGVPRPNLTTAQRKVIDDLIAADWLIVDGGW